MFWQYFLLPGVMYTGERLYREISSRKLRTRVISVTNHPSDVVELQMKKKLFKYKPGQYLFLNCPYLSHWEWHPFTITSSPEEENVSVHIRAVGDWTKVFFFFFFFFFFLLLSSFFLSFSFFLSLSFFPILKQYKPLTHFISSPPSPFPPGPQSQNRSPPRRNPSHVIPNLRSR